MERPDTTPTAAESRPGQTPPNDPGSHARSVSGMFGRIAGWYDLLNRVLSGGLDRYWRYRLVRHVTPGPTGRVLDLAAGTLDVSLEILRQHPGTRVPALDFCRPMLQRGRQKLFGETARSIWPVTADGRSLPLADASVDCVTIAFGIRNIVPRSEAFAEILRVLVPGGRLCVLEFGTGRTPVWRGLYNFYLNRVLPLVGKAVSGDAGAYRYLADTIMSFPTADELATEMTAAGFGRVFHLPLTSGIVRLHVAEKPAAGREAASPAATAPNNTSPDNTSSDKAGTEPAPKAKAHPVRSAAPHAPEAPESPAGAESPVAPPAPAAHAATPARQADAPPPGKRAGGKGAGRKPAGKGPAQGTLPGATEGEPAPATTKKRGAAAAGTGKRKR